MYDTKHGHATSTTTDSAHKSRPVNISRQGHASDPRRRLFILFITRGQIYPRVFDRCHQQNQSQAPTGQSVLLLPLPKYLINNRNYVNKSPPSVPVS